MELFIFFRGLFAWMAAFAVLWPLNIPMAAFAYKVRLGNKPLDIDSDELWTRATLASLVLGLATVGFVFLDWFIIDSLAFPAGPIHVAVVMGYIPAGMWIMTLFFGFSDLMDGLSVFTIYIMLPVVVLWILYQIIPWNPALTLAYDWLLPVEAT